MQDDKVGISPNQEITLNISGATFMAILDVMKKTPLPHEISDPIIRDISEQAMQSIQGGENAD